MVQRTPQLQRRWVVPIEAFSRPNFFPQLGHLRLPTMARSCSLVSDESVPGVTEKSVPQPAVVREDFAEKRWDLCGVASESS